MDIYAHSRLAMYKSIIHVTAKRNISNSHARVKLRESNNAGNEQQSPTVDTSMLKTILNHTNMKHEWCNSTEDKQEASGSE